MSTAAWLCVLVVALASSAEAQKKPRVAKHPRHAELPASTTTAVKVGAQGSRAAPGSSGSRHRRRTRRSEPPKAPAESASPESASPPDVDAREGIAGAAEAGSGLESAGADEERTRFESLVASAPIAADGAAGQVEAEEERAEEPATFKPELQGFLNVGGLRFSRDSAAPMAGLLHGSPDAQGYVEVNAQGKLRAFESYALAADVSLYAGTGDANELWILNEGYADAHWGPVSVSAGRRRVVWGAGFAANPTDLFNPPKNPLSLQPQRTGAFLLPLAEVATSDFTVSAALAPALATNSRALPTGLDFGKPVLGARGYALLAGVDANLMYYRDEPKKRHAFGASASTVVADWYELHGEALLHTGDEDLPPLPHVPACGPPLASSTQGVGGSAVVGGRRDFSDQTFASVEYLYNGAGLGPRNFDRFKEQLGCTRAALANVELTPPNPLSRPLDPPVVLLRHHYLLAVVQRPHLWPGAFEDVGAGVSAVWSLEDRSALVQLRAQYAFAGRVVAAAAVALWLGDEKSEFGLAPEKALGTVELKLSF